MSATPPSFPAPAESPSAPGVSAGAAVQARDVVKVYGTGETSVTALDHVSAGLASGAFTAIMGASGSGKSTLMHCLAGLDTVTSGSVVLGGTELVGLQDKALTLLRRERVGFIFQTFNLLPTLTAAQNIHLPLDIARRREAVSGWEVWEDHVIDTLGLRDRLGHTPAELSGGQQQRVACARAFVTRPEVVFADEPTGNLDSRSGAEVLSFLRMSVRELGQTVVMVTHDAVSASYADRVVFLRDGRLAGEMAEPSPERVLESLKTLDG